ncbi:serine hydrolase domain-containing protein [candidate division CSSED10-310 bacterium]|uniref:Serine hydrolase domain-containing protein n=1 Tax=candidate division CSSED10-310 bacterium TaxID=2855610 RepID=A0ABV6YWU3_UNCC1
MNFMSWIIISTVMCLSISSADESKRERIHQVENSLKLPFIIDGEKPPVTTLREQMKQFAVPGAAIAVIDNLELEWIRAYGVLEHGEPARVENNTLFQAGSISKPVTAWLTLMLVSEGSLKLDAPINTLLRTWKVPENDFTTKSPLLLRHLIIHQAGFAPGAYMLERGKTFPPLVELLQGKHHAPQIKVINEPGTVFAYSNPAYAVLQQVLEDVSGMSLDELAQRKLFKPLGMNRSTFAEPLPAEMLLTVAAGHLKQWLKVKNKALMIPGAPGGLWTTAHDLALFVQEIMKAYQGKSDRTLSQTLARQYVTPQVLNMGLGMYVTGQGDTLRFQYTGGTDGYVAYLTGFPSLGKAAVVLTNSSGGSSLYRKLIGALAPAYRWPNLPVERTTSAQTPRNLTRLVGRYCFDGAPDLVVTISIQDGLLSGQINNYPHFQLKYCQEAIWYIPKHLKEMEFHPPQHGLPAGIYYRTPGSLGNHLTKIE